MPFSTRALRPPFAAGGSVVVRRHWPSGYVRCDHANSNDTPGQSALYGGHPVSETKMNVPKKKKKKDRKKKKNRVFTRLHANLFHIRPVQPAYGVFSMPRQHGGVDSLGW
jgi:hypothetical protein